MNESVVHTESRRHRVAAMREKLTTEDAGKHRELRKPKLCALSATPVVTHDRFGKQRAG